MRDARRRILAVALAAYTVFVCVVTLSPRMPGTGSAALIVNAVLDYVHARGLLVGLDYDGVEFVANIGMFVPLGVLTALLMPPRARWTLLLIGTAFSCVIELYQALLLGGRVGEWRDVLSNSLGFLLGAAAALLVSEVGRNALLRRREQPNAPPQDAPRP